MIPLRVHGRASLGYGTATVEVLAGTAARMGVPALLLTDIETLADQIRFHDACNEAGIRPLTGVELRTRFGRRSHGLKKGRLILVAVDANGWSTLCRIVTARRAGGRMHVTSEPAASLPVDARGIIVLSDDAEALEQVLARGSVSPARAGLLLVRPGGGADERELGSAAARLGVPLVADIDAVMSDVSEHALHALLVAIRHSMRVADAERAGLVEDGARALTAFTPRLFGDAADAVRSAAALADRCTLDLRSAARMPPRLPEIEAADAPALLRERCVVGLHARGRHDGVYLERLEHELGIIARLDYSDYLLTAGEIVQGARTLGIATAGRGSAAGSVAAWTLGITDVDPIKHDLLFERFLHELRPSPPDIDLDVASTRRDELVGWVTRRFGRERVAGIASVATYRARGAVRAGLASLGASNAAIERAAGRIPPADAIADDAQAVLHALETSGVSLARAAAPLIAALTGVPSHIQAHPSGLVIGDRPLETRVPLERAPGGAAVTQFDLRAVELAGLLKFDLLGNHFLSELQDVMVMRKEALRIDLEDGATWSALDRAETIGCFQVESPAMRSVLRRLPIRGFSDLVAALAIVRPGAAAGAAKNRYIRRARGEETFDTLEVLESAPDANLAGLEHRLARSFGVLLYDEDIMRLLAAASGMSLARADALRSAIVAAADSPAQLSGLEEGFLREARASGADEAVARRAWNAAARFAAYSFAEAHAASHALLAHRAVWLRTHLPLEFSCALLNHHRALYPLRTIAADIARRGIDIAPPDVNRSETIAVIERGAEGRIRLGLSFLKGVTRRTTTDILRYRPFRDLPAFTTSVQPSRLELKALILSGACDALAPLSALTYPFVHEAVLDAAGAAAPDIVAERLESSLADPQEAPRIRLYQALVRARNEIETLDMHPSGHPMRLLRPEAARVGCIPSGALPQAAGREVRFAGLLAAARRVATPAGEMRFLTLEDEEGLIEAVLPPAVNRRIGAGMGTPGPVLFTGRVRAEQGDVQLVIETLAPFHERP